MENNSLQSFYGWYIEANAATRQQVIEELQERIKNKEETKLQSEQRTKEEPKTLWQIREEIAHNNGWASWSDMNLPRNTEGSLWALAAEQYASQFKSQLPIEQKANELCQIEAWMKDMNYNNLAVFWAEDGSVLRVADIIQHYLQWITPEP